MYGPSFLLLYGVVIVLTLGVAWITLHGQIEKLSSEDVRFEPNLYDDVVRTCRWIRFIGAFIIAGLGGYKLMVAISKGHHNVMFLILMGIISLCILVSMCAVSDQESRN